MVLLDMLVRPDFFIMRCFRCKGDIIFLLSAASVGELATSSLLVLVTCIAVLVLRI